MTTPSFSQDVDNKLYDLNVADEARQKFAQQRRPPGPPLTQQVLTLDDLVKLPPTRPLVDGLLYRNTLAQLSGGPGTYKTFVAIAMSCSLAAGKSLCGFDVPARAMVIYVAAEGANDVLRRVLAFCDLWGLDIGLVRDKLLVLPLPIQLGDRMDVTEAVDMVVYHSADLLVLDTRARCTLGLEENSATEQGQAIEAAEEIRRAADCTVFGVHHAPRTGGAGRGSNAWDGAVWSDLRIEGSGLHAKLHCEKHKDAPGGCDHYFQFSKHIVPLKLMPSVPEEKNRHTLALSGLDSKPAADQSARQRVVDLVRTIAPPEGFSASQLIAMTALSKSVVYDTLSWAVKQDFIAVSGTGKPTRYVPGQQTPKWGGSP